MYRSATSRTIARSRSASGTAVAVAAQIERYTTIRRFFQQQAGAGQRLLRRGRSDGVEKRRDALLQSEMTGGRWGVRGLGPTLRHAIRWNSTSSGSTGSTKPTSQATSPTTSPQCPNCPHPPAKNDSLSPPQPSTTGEPPPPLSPDHQIHHPPPDYPRFIRRLLARIPHPQAPTNNNNSHSNTGFTFPDSSTHFTPNSQHHPHRPPTKDDLLKAATNIFQRLTIRFKWFSIRGWRRFNADDLSAFASWFVMGNTLWIVIGTTTFFSAVFATLNSLSLQSYVAKGISDYLTKNTGFNVVFESAIVPRWGASTITFRNVYVSRRPTEDDVDDEEDSSDDADDNGTKVATRVFENVGKGGHERLRLASPDDAASLSSSSSLMVNSATTSTDGTSPSGLDEAAEAKRQRLRENNNYTMFDVNFEEVDVTLSLVRWLSGKGLVKEAKVRGVRGVIDRRHVWWDYSKPLVPADFRHQTQVGDFEFESLQIEDFLVTVYQPGGQRPFNVSIFNATIGPFRKRWMFYDLMSADGITGQYDNCLFSLHMPQKLGTRRKEDDKVKRLARFRIDGLPIEHAQYATGFTGPISWITSGKLDAVLDIKFPTHPDDEVDINALLSQISQNISDIARETGMMDNGSKSESDARAAAEAAQAAMDAQLARSAKENEVNPGQHRLAKPALRAPGSDVSRTTPNKTVRVIENKDVVVNVEDPPREVILDIDLRFRDLKAAVPLYTTDLSVRNNALIRPIVAFINANRTLVPIHCTVTSPLSDFDGSWTLFETGLTSSISEQIYAALAYHVTSAAQNRERIRTVGAWGIQRGAQAVLHTLRSVVDPIHSSAQTIMNAGA